MKAIALREHGSLNNIEYMEVAEPTMRSGEVLVQVEAAALNRLDLWVTEGWRGLDLAFPHIMGCDGSGVVERVASDVDDFAPGDRVAINPTRSCGQCVYCYSGRDNLCDRFAIFGEHLPGFYAEYQAVPARNLLALPESVNFDIAAAASLVYVTAWHSLIDVGRFRAGEEILIIGAGGGVNTACIDIARLAGAHKIYVVGSSDEKLEAARHLGAHVTINRHQQDWGKAVYQASERRGVDVVVDNVGAKTFPSSLRALKKGGRLLTVGNTSGPIVKLDNRYVFGKHLKIIGSTMGPRRAYQEVMKLVFAEQLRPAIDSVMPMSEGVEAIKRMADGDIAGKIVLNP